MRKVRKKFQKRSRKNKKREASEVAVAGEAVVVAVLVNHVEDMVIASKKVAEVAEQDPRPLQLTLRSLSLRVKTSKCTQRQVDPKLKSKSRSKVTLKLPRTTTLFCERKFFLIED